MINLQIFEVGPASTFSSTESLFYLFYNNGGGSNNDDYLWFTVQGRGHIKLPVAFSDRPATGTSWKIKVEQRYSGSDCVTTFHSTVSGAESYAVSHACGSYTHAISKVWMEGSSSHTQNGQVDNFYFVWL